MRSLTTSSGSRGKTRTILATAAMLLAAAVSLTVVGCTDPGSTDDSIPDTLRLGIKPDQLGGSYDLATAVGMYGPYDYRAVYEGLFAPNSSLETGGFVPVLATGYEQSEDGKTLTVGLRDDVTFIDGEKLSAPGVKTYLDGMHEVADWWFQSFWDQVSPTLIAVDETTLEIHSDSRIPLDFQRFAHMLFTQIAIASPNVIDDLAGAATQPVGTGPYLIESATPGVAATFVRNEDYWNLDAYPFDNLELTVFADEVAGLNALTAGQIDATRVTTQSAAEADGRGFTINVETAGGSSVGLYIADRDGTVLPALADQRVRQAMAFAFDREAIVQALNSGFGRVSSQPFIEKQREYVPDGDDRYGYDPERAKDLLAAAGYEDGFDLQILTDGGSVDSEPIVTQYLGDIGIRVTFEHAEPGTFQATAEGNKTYPVLMTGMLFPSVMSIFIYPDANYNSFGVADPEIDNRWKVITEGTKEDANQALAELGKYVIDESLIITFRSIPTIWASTPEIEVPFVFASPELADFTYTG